MQKKNAIDFFNEAKYWIKQLKALETQDEKDPASINEEMIDWTQLAIVISNAASINSLLKALQAKLPDDDFKSYYVNVAKLESEGRAILCQLIVPYLVIMGAPKQDQGNQ